MLQTQCTPQRGRYQNDLGINIRAGHAKGFDSNLVKLTVPSLLRTFMAEHGTTIPEALLLVVKQAVLLRRAHTAGGAFRAQTEFIAIAIGKGVHLLFNDIGHFADRAFEKLGLLQHRESNLAISVALDDLRDHLLNVLPQCRVSGEYVVHPANCLDLAHRFSSDSLSSLLISRER